MSKMVLEQFVRERIDGAGSWSILSVQSMSSSFNQAFLAHGRAEAGAMSVFVKASRHADAAARYRDEVAGLAELREAGCVRVPLVHGVIAGTGVTYLVMEGIAPHDPQHAHWERLGSCMARLHRCTSLVYGLSHDNWLGSLPQINHTRQFWPDFYAQLRLEPLLQRASEERLLSDSEQGELKRLIGKLGELCGPPERPALLHGDFWRGNVLFGPDPVLVDPAVHYGHREMDLAMAELFGGFEPSFFSAYDAEYPLADGYVERRPLWQVYPLLAHVVLFGRNYVPPLMDAIAAVR